MPPLDTHVLFALVVANFYYISQLVEIFDSVIHGLGVFTTGLISWGFLLRGFVLGFLRFIQLNGAYAHRKNRNAILEVCTYVYIYAIVILPAAYV